MLFNKKIFIVLIVFVFSVLLFTLFNFSTVKQDIDLNYQEAFYKNYKIFAIEIPDNIEFAGEKVNTKRFDIRDALDRELLINTYWQSQTIMMIKKANRFFPLVEPILKKYNVPDDFKYLGLAESGFFNNLVSPAGAAGIWQFMKESGSKYGLEINENIDERYNPEKATEAACKYILDSYKIYKNWTLAAASYNVGIGALTKQMELQKSVDYYSLFLNNETSRYIYRIIALKLIISNPKNFGFYLRKKDLYPPIPTYTIKVDSSIKDLAGFAKKIKINYKLLREFNMWIRKPILENSANKTYYLTIPKEGYINYDTLYSNIVDEPLLFSDSIAK
ncbi:MAG: lytic transglycosylase domain-containing protein [Bacteroidetes bacterium]|nr:lytic transglycosylase domain-containing protein [Bacteroidota bacterium]